MQLVCSYTPPARSSLSDETLLTNVMCGVLSGVISSSIANPTDVLKVATRLRESRVGACVLPFFCGSIL